MAYTLKQARLLAGKTQREMADELSIHRDTYLKLEKNPELTTIKQAKKISEITQISYNDIFFAS